MKKIIEKISLAVILFLVFVFTASADFSFEKWQYEKELKTPAGGLAEVTIDNEIFAKASLGLADVRIVDEKNQETPYKLVTPKGSLSETEYTPKLINNSVAEGKYASVILDLGAGGLLTNSLTIQTASSNFQRNVTIYGSDNQTDWQTLKAGGYIYDYTDEKAKVKTQNTTVAFNESNFRFLKLEVAEVDRKPILINSVGVKRYLQEELREFKLSPSFEVAQVEKEKTTRLIVDLGQSGIPTSRLVLEAGGENFNRSLLVYASNDKNSTAWRQVGSGYLFRYDTPKFKGENSSVKISETTERYLKVVIDNQDNAPLNFAKITALATYRDLVFQAQAGSSYRLFYGNPGAKAPQYDLEKYFQYLDLNTVQNATLSAQKNNAQFIPALAPVKPFSERYATLLSVALVTMGAILLLLVYKFLKK